VYEDRIADNADLDDLNAVSSPAKPRMSARVPLAPRTSVAMDLADDSLPASDAGRQTQDITTEHEEYAHPIQQALYLPAPPAAALLALMAVTNTDDRQERQRACADVIGRVVLEASILFLHGARAWVCRARAVIDRRRRSTWTLSDG
jgi:hypothetical protein